MDSDVPSHYTVNRTNITLFFCKEAAIKAEDRDCCKALVISFKQILNVGASGVIISCFHFVNKLLRRSLLPTRCDLDLDFQRQKKVYCVKTKQLLVKCMVNELISHFQVFKLIC